MLRHIVLFRLKPFDNEEDKLRQLNLIKSELEALQSLIPAINFMRMYINENPAEDFDFMLETEVASIEELPKYAEHPEHIRVASQYIKPYAEKRACVDFTI